MREILFRGKRVDNGEWVYGNLISNIFFYHNPKRSAFYIMQNESDNDNWEDIVSDLDDFEVIPETVGQYTGLVDDSGDKIYEGDIVVWELDNGHKRTAPIIFDEYQAVFWMGKSVESGMLVCNDWMRGSHYIVGNVHDTEVQND